MAQGKREEAMALKEEVTKQAQQLAELEKQESDLSAKVTEIMMQIPNIIDPSVPIGKDDSQNVEIEKFGDPFVPDFEIPYHTEIMEKFNGIDLDSARKVAGNGFYCLLYTSDDADERSSVDLCGSRIIKKKIKNRK